MDWHWQPPGWLSELVDVMTAFEIDPEGGPGGEILARDGLVWTKLPVMKRTLRDHMPGTIGCHRVGPESVMVWWELDQPAAAWTLICREPPAEVQAELAEARAGELVLGPRVGRPQWAAMLMTPDTRRGSFERLARDLLRARATFAVREWMREEATAWDTIGQYRGWDLPRVRFTVASDDDPESAADQPPVPVDRAHRHLRADVDQLPLLLFAVPEIVWGLLNRAMIFYAYGFVAQDFASMAAHAASLALERALEDAFGDTLTFPITVALRDAGGDPYATFEITHPWAYSALKQLYHPVLPAIIPVGHSVRRPAQILVSGQPLPATVRELAQWAHDKGWLSPHEQQALVGTIDWCRPLPYHTGSYGSERTLGILRDCITLTNRLWARKDYGHPIAPEHAYIMPSDV